MACYSSENSMCGKEGFQEIILINGLDKVVEDEFEIFNSNARMKKRSEGYFYNTLDKNVYLNEFTWNNGGAGFCQKLLMDYSSHENQLKFTNAAKIKDWIPIYEHTKFLINSNDGSAWFSFQFLPKEARYLKRPFAIISAENPSMGEQEETLNEVSNEAMINTLNDLEYEFYQSIGELSGYVENCFIIYNIDKDEAINLGLKFQQESIVFNNGESICILECFTKKVALAFEFKHIDA